MIAHPCPLCGGEGETNGEHAWCAKNCGMETCRIVPWNRLSALAAQNKRRGEALEELIDLVEDNMAGSYTFDSLSLQPAKEALKNDCE